MNRFKKIKHYYNWGGRFINDSFNIETQEKSNSEIRKTPYRYDIINFLLTSLNRDTTYLEIGVRNPNDNFNKIDSKIKYSVDPGIEFKENPVDFKVTSDEFFDKLRRGEVLTSNIKFDVIFIDGLHLAEQVDRDIKNALEFIKDDGYIVLHDCNPPSEWHARENHSYSLSPAGYFWNGTTWKAFLKARYRNDITSACIDTDWGVGVISKNKFLGKAPVIQNEFFEFSILEGNRKELLNLISFDELKERVSE